MLYKFLRYYPLFICLSLNSYLCYSQVRELTDEEVIKYFENKKDITVYYSNKITLPEYDKQFSKFTDGLLYVNNDPSKWQAHVVKKDENLYNIINDSYGFYDNGYKNTTDAILETVADQNKVNSQYKIFAGQVIKIPDLPKRTYLNEDRLVPTVGQFYDYANNKTFICNYRNYVNGGPSTTSFDVRATGFTAVTLPPDSVPSFVTHYSTDFFHNNLAYAETGSEICEIESDEISGGENECPKLEIASAATLSELQKINVSKVDSFFVFDVFKYKEPGQTCSHGDKVLAVINHIFDQYNLVTLKSKVKPVSIDFFDNRIESMKIVENYLSEKAQNNQLQEQINLKRRYYELIDKGDCIQNCAPSDFLNILLDVYMSKRPEVISMSFFMKPTIPVFNYQLTTKMYTNLLCAALNNRSSIEVLFEDPATLEGRKYEPLFTIKSNIPDKGVLIVGGEDIKGTYNCLFSDDGRYVSAIGKGRWRESFNCNPEEYGSSFATPEVATKLFIAKAYWKSLNLNVNAIEARTRLLLASDLDENFVGKFSSAGKIDINKLIIDRGAYIERNDSIVRIQSVKPSSKIIYEDEQGNLQNVYIHRTKKEGNCSGLTVSKNVIYIFSENEMKWRALPNVKTISIEIIDKSNVTTTIKSLDELQTQEITKIVQL